MKLVSESLRTYGQVSNAFRSNLSPVKLTSETTQDCFVEYSRGGVLGLNQQPLPELNEEISENQQKENCEEFQKYHEEEYTEKNALFIYSQSLITSGPANHSVGNLPSNYNRHNCLLSTNFSTISHNYESTNFSGT